MTNGGIADNRDDTQPTGWPTLNCYMHSEKREREIKILLPQSWDGGSGCVLQNKIITWNGCLGTYLTSSYSPVSLDGVKNKIVRFYTCKFYGASVRKKCSWIFFPHKMDFPQRDWTYCELTVKRILCLTSLTFYIDLEKGVKK